MRRGTKLLKQHTPYSVLTIRVKVLIGETHPLGFFFCFLRTLSIVVPRSHGVTRLERPGCKWPRPGESQHRFWQHLTGDLAPFVGRLYLQVQVAAPGCMFSPVTAHLVDHCVRGMTVFQLHACLVHPERSSLWRAIG